MNEINLETMRLTWDLFVLVFFIVVISYSFILGRNTTMKVIIASYMSILVADGLGELIEFYLVPAALNLSDVMGEQVVILSKIFIFIVSIVVFVVKGGFQVNVLPERSMPTRMLANLSFGFLNAGLLVNTLLVYLTGGSFLFSALMGFQESALYKNSLIIQLMVDNTYIWFAAPALAFLLVSVFESRES